MHTQTHVQLLQYNTVNMNGYIGFEVLIEVVLLGYNTALTFKGLRSVISKNIDIFKNGHVCKILLRNIILFLKQMCLDNYCSEYLTVKTNYVRMSYRATNSVKKFIPLYTHFN
jgi:hypothetical protein